MSGASSEPCCPHRPGRRGETEGARKRAGRSQASRKGPRGASSRILENLPVTFTAPQLRVLLRAFITCDLYGQSDLVATHYAGEDDENNQSSEEILLSVADRLEEAQIPDFLLRLALALTSAFPTRTKSTT